MAASRKIKNRLRAKGLTLTKIIISMFSRATPVPFEAVSGQTVQDSHPALAPALSMPPREQNSPVGFRPRSAPSPRHPSDCGRHEPANLRRPAKGLSYDMKMSKLTLCIAAMGLIGGGTALASDPLADAVLGKTKDGNQEKLVFVTGSRIPKRVQVKAIGTNTTSPVRVYTRAEIDRTGRFTTAGILAQDPSISILGNGSR